MSDFEDFANDGLVDALLMEISSLLGRLVEHGEEGSIDLGGLPLSSSCLADLEERLGRGEVTAVIEAAGRSTLHETSLPGVWWAKHQDEAGRVIATLVEVARVPHILAADPADIELSRHRIRDRTHLATHAQSRAAP